MNIFNYSDYKIFLNTTFDHKNWRGQRKLLAEFLGCGPGFVSQVLKGDKTHFSLEHVEKIANFMELSVEEKRYLLLLAQYAKAGSEDLRQFFFTEIEHIQAQSQLVSKRIEKSGKGLNDAEKAVYYGHWAYMAVHMIISIKEFRTLDKIQQALKLPPAFISNVVNFLLETGLIMEEQGKLKIGKTRIHLESKSPFINSLHQNWRQKAIESLPNENDLDLHYSSVMTLSKKDSLKIRQLILEFIKMKEEILIPSADETIVVLNIDYFKL